MLSDLEPEREMLTLLFENQRAVSSNFGPLVSPAELIFACAFYIVLLDSELDYFLS